MQDIENAGKNTGNRKHTTPTRSLHITTIHIKYTSTINERKRKNESEDISRTKTKNNQTAHFLISILDLTDLVTILLHTWIFESISGARGASKEVAFLTLKLERHERHESIIKRNDVSETGTSKG